MTLRGPSRLTGHLGSSVSALVDGQLDADATERAWQHVEQCAACRRLVEREGWVKRQLAHIAETPSAEVPSDRFVGALLDLDPTDTAWSDTAWSDTVWSDTAGGRGRGRGRRRVGLAVVGAGSVSAAVLGLSTLSGVSVGLGGSPAPAASIGRASSSSPATPKPSPSASSPLSSSLALASPTGAPLLPVGAPTTAVRGQLPSYLLGIDPGRLARPGPASARR